MRHELAGRRFRHDFFRRHGAQNSLRSRRLGKEKIMVFHRSRFYDFRNDRFHGLGTHDIPTTLP